MSPTATSPIRQFAAPVSDRRYAKLPAAPRGLVNPPSGVTAPHLRVRIRPDNPDHHLWNNHGTWYLHYTVHPTPFTKQRVRRSLGTTDLEAARERRDAFFVLGRLEGQPAGLEAVA